MAHSQAVATIMQRRIDAGKLHIDLTQWLLLECVVLERTLAIVLEIACGNHPALRSALLEEAQSRISAESEREAQ